MKFFSLIRPILDMVGAATILICIFQFYMDGDFLTDLSDTSETVYKEKISPLVDFSYTKYYDHKRVIDSVGPDALNEIVPRLVDEDNLRPKLAQATWKLETIIKCYNSIFCRVDGYENYKRDIVQYWFFFKPVLLEMRKERSDFGATLELEAYKHI